MTQGDGVGGSFYKYLENEPPTPSPCVILLDGDCISGAAGADFPGSDLVEGFVGSLLRV